MRFQYLYKENIDGEALTWAHARSLAHARSRKVLIMISDGAPVDDASLTHNWPTILVDHLLQVIAAITAEGRVVLGGLGVEHDLRAFFPNSAAARPIACLADVGPRFVEEMIALAHAAKRKPT